MVYRNLTIKNVPMLTFLCCESPVSKASHIERTVTSSATRLIVALPRVAWRSGSVVGLDQRS